MSEFVEPIENYFSKDNSDFGSFFCPNCEDEWGPSNDGDPPCNSVDKVKCTCGAILRVSGEWDSRYSLEADMETLKNE